MMTNSEGKSDNTGVEEDEFKVVLRFNEEKGVQGMSPVKVTTILKNQVGEVRMAKVLRDGNLLIMCNNKEQKERACRMREVGKHKVLSFSRVEKRYMWNRGGI